MADGDFEQTFQGLGLSPTESNGLSDATFASGEHSPTLALDPVDGRSLGTLPRLTLATPDAVGEDTTAGELVVVDVLGEGGMGQVLLARQHSLGREVAVKVLKAGEVNPAAAEALIQEARTTGSLEHPNVVPVYALARDARGLPALVMKRVDGVSWRLLLQNDEHPGWERISRGRDRLEANLEVLIQVCNALAHAHQRGVIHRDLKPANILIGELGEVYVADWGIAIQKARLKPGPTRLVGTPAYLAPEMVTGDATLTDERTDIYLLGGMLHEVLTGCPTHRGSSIRDVLEEAWTAAPPTFSAEVPRELALICTRALAADPRNRFQSAVELRDALRVFIQHRGSIQLSNAAATRLKKLEVMAKAPLTAAEERGWYALISECRFGFSQALEADPQSEIARALLGRCLEIATVRELGRGAAGAARAFLAEMKAPPPALEAELRALEAKEAERAMRDERLAHQAHQNDPVVSAPERNTFILMLAVLVMANSIVFGILTGPRTYLEAELGHWSHLIPNGIICCVYLAAVGVGRKALLATRLNRQMVAVMGIGAFSLFVGRVQFEYLGLPIGASLVHGAGVMAAMMLVCAFLLHWSFALGGALFFVGGVGVMLFSTSYPLGFFTLFTALGLATTVVTFRFWARDVEKRVTK